MAQSFVVPNLWIMTKSIELANPPSLESDHLRWLEDSNISEWTLEWVPNFELEWACERYPHWDTQITFKNPQEALLWKLRWA